uniref:Calcium-transporting P-type ATPase N-terminal autoinhibitory domain-containing protein n=1 Tax=Salix viminalis TaxID=40686 RepID=A0A6N2MP48_SALVM
MENYLNENFGDVKGKNSSEEALQRWRNLCWLVKNRKRRFRFTANLSKRFEAEAIREAQSCCLGFKSCSSVYTLFKFV